MKVSVVMTCYNGEKFISKQIQSIICQLSIHDELIIINDCSTDNSLKVIQSFNSRLIKVFSNDKNIGVISSFEKGLCKARNEIIFLSDQDDIWGNNKVSIYKKNFLESGCDLVCSDAELIDSDGNKILSSFFSSEYYFGFSKSIFLNFIKNRYLGCTLAFRRDLLKYILPFPSWISMHDIYIGNLASIIGKVCQIDEHVFSYRRHDMNVTSLSRINIKTILINRAKFFAQTIVILFRLVVLPNK
jgi:glycosyltransferase involved in cell wall biosynthesis